MTSLIAHTLRLAPASFGGYHAEGWHPTLSITLVGPAPAGARVQWSVRHPDGAVWFEHRVSAPELGAGETASIDLRPGAEAGDLDVAGAVAFTLRLVSELEGVDLFLHEGSVRVVALEGEHRFAVDGGGRSRRGHLALDVLDEPDAPRLRASLFLAGEAEAWEFEAFLLHDGRRIARADAVESRFTATANDGTVVGCELGLRFDEVRGWNNLRDSGWGAGWHLLDEHDGHYEVKLLREGSVVRVLEFAVAGGRLVPEGLVERDPWLGAVIEVPVHDPAAAEEQAPDAPGGEAEAGDAAGGQGAVGLDEVYALRAEPQAPAPAEGGDRAVGAVDAVALRAFFDRAERLLLTWEGDLIDTAPPFDHAQVLTAEAVQAERAGYLGLRDAASAIPDDHPVELAGEATTIGGLRTRMAALLAAADARVEQASRAGADALAPYRAVLSGDKLAVFEEHPADAFLYTTTDRRVIETPDELAAAEYWFFEGPLDLPSTATVDGVRVDVTVQGWRVLGWRFAPDHSVVDEFETQGHGSSAPKSAYRPPA